MDEAAEIFENTTQGYVGAIKVDRRGERRSISVAPGDRVELTEEEQQITAESHRDPKGNPFIPQDYKIHDANNGALLEEGRRPPLQKVTDRRPIGSDQPAADGEVGAAAEPAGDPPQGSYAPGEEVGTPEGGLKTAADIGTPGAG